MRNTDDSVELLKKTTDEGVNLEQERGKKEKILVKDSYRSILSMWGCKVGICDEALKEGRP